MRSEEPGPGGAGWIHGLRWTARVLAILMVVMVVVVLVGEGAVFRRFTGIEWAGAGAFTALCAGLLLGWRRELAGGILALTGLALFCAVELTVNGRMPRGPAWPLIAVPGILYLIVGGARHASRGRPLPPRDG